MSIIDAIFGQRTPAAPAPAPIPNPNPNAATPPIPGVDPNNPITPPGTPQGNTGADAQDPFKDFAGIWDIDPTKVNEAAPFFANIDQAKVFEAASKTNFMQMTAEQKAAIEAGGPQAFQAMQQILNKAAQSVYGHSALATSKMVDKAVAAAREQMLKQLPALMTKHQATIALQQENPIFSNPALQPMVEAMRDRFAAKNPNATPAEIKQQVELYFTTVGAQFAPAPAVDPRAPAPQKQTDWDNWFNQ